MCYQSLSTMWLLSNDGGVGRGAWVDLAMEVDARCAAACWASVAHAFY